MNLVAEYDSDSTDEEEVKPKEKVVLPPADDVLQSTTNTSVFTTSFDRKEEEQREVLERHVTMVENKDNITQVNGRKVCWMYRRGRCRAGRKCQMFHDSELREKQQKIPTREMNHHQPINFHYIDDVIEDDESQLPRKRRYGVTDTLAPPSRALAEIRRIGEREKRSRKTKH